MLYVEHPAEFHLLSKCQTLFILPDILYGGKWKNGKMEKMKKYDTKSKSYSIQVTTYYNYMNNF